MSDFNVLKEWIPFYFLPSIINMFNIFVMSVVIVGFVSKNGSGLEVIFPSIYIHYQDNKCTTDLDPESLTVWCVQVKCAARASAAPSVWSASKVCRPSVKQLIWPCPPESTLPSSSQASSEKRFILMLINQKHSTNRSWMLFFRHTASLCYSFSVRIHKIRTIPYGSALHSSELCLMCNQTLLTQKGYSHVTAAQKPSER